VVIEDTSISPRVLLNSPVLTHKAVNFLVTRGGCGAGAGAVVRNPGFAEPLAGKRAFVTYVSTVLK
jgi:hypothetical protein